MPHRLQYATSVAACFIGCNMPRTTSVATCGICCNTQQQLQRATCKHRLQHATFDIGYSMYVWQMVTYSLVNQIQGSWLKKEPQLKLQDIESQEQDRCSKLAYQYARELAYDGGAWAMAYIIHLSGKTNLEFWQGDFWPSIGRLGWKQAISQYTKLANIEEFYDKFDAFIRQKNLTAITSIILDQIPPNQHPPH